MSLFTCLRVSLWIGTPPIERQNLAERAMRIELRKGTAENQVAHIIAVQKTIWKIKTKVRDRTEARDLIASQFKIKATKVILTLCCCAAAENWDHITTLLAHPVNRNLRWSAANLIGKLAYCFASRTVGIAYLIFAARLIAWLAVLAGENPTLEHAPRQNRQIVRARHLYFGTLDRAAHQRIWRLEGDRPWQAKILGLGDRIGDHPGGRISITSAHTTKAIATNAAM